LVPISHEESVMHLRECQEIACATDLNAFEAHLRRFANDMDFGIINGTLLSETDDSSLVSLPFGEIPEAFRSTWVSNERCRRDPVMQRLKRLRSPFVYDQSMYVDEGSADIWEVQAQYGFKTGIAMRLYCGPGVHFLIGVDRDAPMPGDSQVARMAADLYLFAAYAQVAALRFLAPPEHRRAEAPKLTAREREIMRWTSEGKSAWAVGQIIHTSEHTVNYHLRHIMTKLCVGSKHQAVAKARTLGLL